MLALVNFVLFLVDSSINLDDSRSSFLGYDHKKGKSDGIAMALKGPVYTKQSMVTAPKKEEALGYNFKRGVSYMVMTSKGVMCIFMTISF